MNETVNQENMNETVNQEQEERTFSQAEVDAIIADRLRRDRAKFADYDALKAKAAKFDEIEEASKSELQKAQEKAESLQKKLDEMTAAATVREIRDRVAAELDVPAALLTAETEDGCRAQAEALLAFKNQNQTGSAYPHVRDAGEANVTGKATPRQKFAEWAEQALG